jgi:hypothetical protein
VIRPPRRSGTKAGHFSSLDHSAADTLNLRVMGENMDTPVAAAKERAQNPADNADHNRAPERAGKSLNVKTYYDVRHNEQHQAIYDQNE